MSQQTGLLLDALVTLGVLGFFLWANFLTQPSKGIMPTRVRITRGLLGYGAVFILLVYLSSRYL